MNKRTALFYAVEALRKERQKVAFMANMLDKLHVDTPSTHNASIQSARLTEAMQILARMRAYTDTEEGEYEHTQTG